ncbi:hypothetical protein LXL04_015501 [Taraxacum kok-saghyz]
MLFTATCNNLDINPNLRSIGLVIFPIINQGKYYMLCFDLKKPSYVLIDHIVRMGTTANRYGPIPLTLHKFFCYYLKSQRHPSLKALSKMEANIQNLPWSVIKSGDNCGLYLMRHMECYMGEREGMWETGATLTLQINIQPIFIMNQTSKHKSHEKSVTSCAMIEIGIEADQGEGQSSSGANNVYFEDFDMSLKDSAYGMDDDFDGNEERYVLHRWCRDVIPSPLLRLRFNDLNLDNHVDKKAIDILSIVNQCVTGLCHDQVKFDEFYQEIKKLKTKFGVDGQSHVPVNKTS